MSESGVTPFSFIRKLEEETKNNKIVWRHSSGEYSGYYRAEYRSLSLTFVADKLRLVVTTGNDVVYINLHLVDLREAVRLQEKALNKISEDRVLQKIKEVLVE